MGRMRGFLWDHREATCHSLRSAKQWHREYSLHLSEALDWQTFQMLQAIHFLWPPFLFGYLYRKWWSAAGAALETMVHNLPHAKP